MAFSLISHTLKLNATNDPNSVATDPIDTSGANFLTVNVTHYPPGGAITVSDSKGNTPWIELTGVSDANTGNRWFYCIPTTVGTNHLFGVSGTGVYPGMSAQAWSSGSDVAEFDQETGLAGTASSAKPGAITPGGNDALLVCGIGDTNVLGSRAIDASFTIADQNSYIIPTSGYAGAMAYRIISGAPSSIDPEWTGLGTAFATSLVSFLLAAPGATGKPTNYYAQQRRQ